MKAALLLLLVASVASAEAPINRSLNLYQPEAPEMVDRPNWILTPEGKAHLDDGIAKLWSEKERLRAENAALREKTLELAAQPALTWKGALILVGVGILAGGAVVWVVKR